MLHTSPTGRVRPFVLLISTHLLILILCILNNVTGASERWEVLSYYACSSFKKQSEAFSSIHSP